MPADCNVILREDKSFVYDLDVQRGIVSSRVALLLRSAEIKPLLSDLLFPGSSWREPVAARIWGGGQQGKGVVVFVCWGECMAGWRASNTSLASVVRWWGGQELVEEEGAGGGRSKEK